jgi:hypothetical protein
MRPESKGEICKDHDNKKHEKEKKEKKKEKIFTPHAKCSKPRISVVSSADSIRPFSRMAAVRKKQKHERKTARPNAGLKNMSWS